MEPEIDRLSIRRNIGPCSARDILSMVTKHLTAKSETKALHAQFRSVHTCYGEHVYLGISVITHCLFSHKISRLKWDKIDEGLMIAVNLTNFFLRLVIT